VASISCSIAVPTGVGVVVGNAAIVHFGAAGAVDVRNQGPAVVKKRDEIRRRETLVIAC